MTKTLPSRPQQTVNATAVVYPITAAAALFILGAGSLWLYHWARDLHRFTQGISGYIALFLTQFTIYLLACYVVTRRLKDSTRTMTLIIAGIVLLFAAAFRFDLVPQRPYLSTDVYRYIWDGRVQANGINPYRYVPSAPEIEYLRDDKIYPKINRSDYYPTPYPPVAQMLFLLAHVIHPSVTAFKALMSAFDLIAIVAIMIALARTGRHPAQAVIFAWHPILIFETAHTGHLESGFIIFLALALLAWSYRQDTLTGVALALAALVKFYPALLLPVFLRSNKMELSLGNGQIDDIESKKDEPQRHGAAGPQGKRQKAKGKSSDSEARSLPDFLLKKQPIVDRLHKYLKIAQRVFSIPVRLWRTLTREGLLRLANRGNIKLLTAFVVTFVLAYLPYLSAGLTPFLSLSNEFDEEGFTGRGSRYFFLSCLRHILPVPTLLFLLIAVFALLLLGLWWMLKPKENAETVARGAMALIGLYLFISTPRYPWYYAWILPFVCFAPRLSWLYLTGATVLLYCVWFTPYFYPDIPLWIGASIFVPTLVFLFRERRSSQ